MSVINQAENLARIAYLDLPFIELEIEGSVQPSARVLLDLPFIDFQIIGGRLQEAEADLELDFFDFNITGRIDDEANVFGAVNLDLDFLEMQAPGSVRPDAIAALELAFFDFTINSTLQAAERSELNLSVEVLPESMSGNYKNFGARLSVGGTPIPIVSYDETEDANLAGKSVTVELLKFTDKSLLTPNAEFLIELAENGVWETVLTGKLTKKSFSIGNSGNKPNDTVTATFRSTLDDRLGKVPENNLVIYDSARLDLDPSEFEPVYDTIGRAYQLEAMPVGGLTLEALFNEIFVTRCGFAEVKTNLPAREYKLRRADFSNQSNYLAGVAPHIGQFDPLVFPDEADPDILWVIDATAVLPAGFPAPQSLSASKIEGFSSDADFDEIDGFELQFSQGEDGDYYTTRTETNPQEIRTEFGQLISKSVTETKIREYRNNAAPGLILREVTEQIVKTTYGAASILPIAIETENFTFDYLGRQKKSVKTVQKRVPELPSGDYVMREILSEFLNYKYAVHPFFPTRQIVRRTEFSQTGLVAIDSENQYFGENFPQAFTDAHRTGNLTDTMTEQTALIRSVVENFKPLPDGTCKCFTTEIDHTPEKVGKPAIVTSSIGEPRSGDVSLPGTGRAGRMYVYKDDSIGTIRRNTPMETFSVGELPLRFAIPLARRRLKRRNTKNENLSVLLPGWDLRVRRGSVRAVSDRAGNTVNIIVEGYRRFARAAGKAVDFGMTLTGKQI